MNSDNDNIMEFEMIENPYIEEVDNALEDVRRVKSKVEKLIRDGNERLKNTKDSSVISKLREALRKQNTNLRTLETSESKLVRLRERLEKGENVWREPEMDKKKPSSWWFWGGGDEVSELLTEVREQLKDIEGSIDKIMGGGKRRSHKKAKKSLKKSLKKRSLKRK